MLAQTDPGTTYICINRGLHFSSVVNFMFDRMSKFRKGLVKFRQRQVSNRILKPGLLLRQSEDPLNKEKRTPDDNHSLYVTIFGYHLMNLGAFVF